MQLKVCRVELRPHFVLVDSEGRVCEEVVAEPFSMYPGKFLPFEEVVAQLEQQANEKEDDIRELMRRPILNNGSSSNGNST